MKSQGITLKEVYTHFGEYLRLTGRSFLELFSSRRYIAIASIFITVLLSLKDFLHYGAIAIIVNALENTLRNDDQMISTTFILFFLIVAYSLPYFLYPLKAYFDNLINYDMQQIIELRVMRKWSGMNVALREDPTLNDAYFNARQYGLYRLYNFIMRNIYMITHMFQFVIASVVVVSFNPWLYFFFIIFSSPEFIVDLKYSHTIWNIYSSEAPFRRRFMFLSKLLSQKTNIQELDVNTTSHAFIKKVEGMFSMFFDARAREEKKRLHGALISLLFSQGASLVLYGVMIQQVIAQEIQIGTFIFFVTSLMILKNTFAVVAQDLSKQYQDMKIVSQLFEFFDIENSIRDTSNGVGLPFNKAPRIEFRNVSFSYPHDNECILKNINCIIEPGQKIAIVGINGAGKSTLIKLLLRFYDVTDGEILINGTNIKNIDLSSYYRLVGVLFQDYLNYEFLVDEAIATSSSSLDIVEENILQSARKSGAHEFIEKYKNTYKTQLGKEHEGGVDPSVGQWQKLAMARTFYKNPYIYILDEPTASIDVEAEERIFNSLAELDNDRTVILISHRFSTVRKADRIIVLEAGHIKEDGSHDELMLQHGRYYELFTKQAAGYR